MLNPRTRSCTRRAISVLLFGATALGATSPAAAQDAGQLRARYESLRDPLAHSPFDRPLVLQSTQADNKLSGTVHAVIEQPFATVGPALASAAHWCDLLMLHLNVKACSAHPGAAGESLSTVLGRKIEQPTADSGYKVEFAYRVAATQPDYLRVEMNADEGPLGTSDYRLALEAAPIDGRHTFVHLSYAYAYGTVARLAMEGYLSTLGRGKVGFSVTGRRANNEPIYVDGVRGVIERNTMRYFLAIEAYLGAPTREQQERRLNDWFAATEQHALQLHEISREDYLAMKHHELERLRGAAQP